MCFHYGCKLRAIPSSGDYHIPWLVVSLFHLHSQQWEVKSFSCCIFLVPTTAEKVLPFWKLHGILDLTNLDNPGKSLQVKTHILNHIAKVLFALPCKVTYSQVLGRGYEHFWRRIILHTTFSVAKLSISPFYRWLDWGKVSQLVNYRVMTWIQSLFLTSWSFLHSL